MAWNLSWFNFAFYLYCWFSRETEEDFQLLLDFLQEAQLDRVGCFKFSPAGTGAVATDMEDQIPEEIKEERFPTVSQLQQKFPLNVYGKNW